MAKNGWRIHVDGNIVTLIHTSYGATTFTVKALESGILRIAESYKPESGKDTAGETSIAAAAVDRHTIDVYNV